MTRLGASYEIARSTGVCAATGRKLEVGEDFVAVLVEGGGDGAAVLQRLDFAVDAWEKGERPRPPLRVFGYWRAKVQPPGASKRALIDDDALLELFEQLEGAEEPSKISFRFVLALILVRKKVMRYEGTRRDGAGSGPVLLVRRATRVSEPVAELVEVADPDMDEAAVGAAVQELGAIMAGSDNPAGSTAEATGEAAGRKRGGGRGKKK